MDSTTMKGNRQGTYRDIETNQIGNRQGTYRDIETNQIGPN